VFDGAFVWARRALNSQKRRFPARAGIRQAELAALRSAEQALHAQLAGP
jgi:hypothetical protein